MKQHISFPSIEGLHNVLATYNVRPDLFPETTVYRGKVKLHGSNAGVRVTRERVYAQSRTIDLGENDKFAKFVKENEDYFLSRWNGADFVIFGEWCGPGIQKKVAVTGISESVFAIFMIQNGPSDDFDTECVYDPEAISEIMGELPSRIHVLPWYGETLSITWNDRSSIERAASIVTDVVQEIEACDPWVKENFGVEGIGEGMVYYPMHVTKRAWIGGHMFKVKGLEHKVKRSDKIVEIDPERAASVAEFVEMFVTEARLEQGLGEVDGKFLPELTGQFVGWICKDVMKESKEELAISGMIWKDVAKSVGAAASKWFITKSKEI